MYTHISISLMFINTYITYMQYTTSTTTTTTNKHDHNELYTNT